MQESNEFSLLPTLCEFISTIPLFPGNSVTSETSKTVV